MKLFFLSFVSVVVSVAIVSLAAEDVVKPGPPEKPDHDTTLLNEPLGKKAITLPKDLPMKPPKAKQLRKPKKEKRRSKNGVQ